jgi:hypothetical protein
MLSTRQIETFLERVPSHLQDIVLELRNVIASVEPDAVEVVGRGGLSYSHKGRGATVGLSVCQIEIHEDEIRLAFIRGSFLSEPRNLFEGKQKYKRFIRIASYENAPWDYLKKLIVAASRFDPYSIKA